MDEADMDAHPDTVLAGRYRLLATLGAGGMGTVWRASDELLDREVAVKLFAPASGHSGDEARRRTEMHLLAGTAHPAVVALFDAQLEGDPAYLVMELVDGEDLATRLTRGPVPPAQTRGIGLAMAAALESLARRGAVHRDVKPSNILLPGEGSALPAKLADFGIARLADDAGLTTAGTTIGTAAYLSPEQVAGREPTPKADVYSLGLVLLECLTGERAFPGTVSETAAARLVREPTVPRNSARTGRGC
ncbi:hypothetical protein GCM10025881_04560 [Pseudolysinimonas kribbensis]|uniref:non-specific serine/threonine protein kinase n=1 Tax=Pseudolysinimonas kribbensis TaxID=433641 RepID=A0ABQ6K440_9MICO|nr:serine/threonine-protein kinase [Pseudolysinimonas kribbensis]GMA93632.1 hypothetical protein GCM10025881_04560 [Pseudolysinimonas kribbensis]